jgi:hypothetical protein
MKTIEEIIAEDLYTLYCEAVGGVNFQGDPLPNWTSFRNDSKKKKQSDAWIVVAKRVMETSEASTYYKNADNAE